MEIPNGIASTTQKGIFGFTCSEFHRSPQGDTPQQRHRQDFAFGEDAIEVFKVNWHEIDIGPLLRQVKETTLEWLRLEMRGARAFRKQDQRMSGIERLEHIVQRIFMNGHFAPFNEQRMKNLFGHPST